jgi:hypothetical protein
MDKINFQKEKQFTFFSFVLLTKQTKNYKLLADWQSRTGSQWQKRRL